MGLGGRGIGDHGYLVNKGVGEEVEGENNSKYNRDIQIQNLYRRRADEGVQ